MAIKKIEMRPKGTGDYADILYPRTSTDMVDGYKNTRTARFIVGTSTAGWTATDCDYLCDGTDDQVQFNAAIAALPAGGGKIAILDGLYVVSAATNIPANVTIQGQGQSTIIRLFKPIASDLSMFTVSGSNVQVCDLLLDGNTQASWISIGISITATCSNILITNVIFSAFRGHGINSATGVNFTKSLINNCTFKNFTNYRYAISIYTNSSNLSVVDNIFDSCAGGALNFFTGVSDPINEGVIIARNNVIGVSVGKAFSLQYFIRSLFTGNFISTVTTAAGMTMSNSTHSIISSNVFKNIGQQAIYLTNTSDQNVIQGNGILDVYNSGANTNGAIEIAGSSSYNNIQGNTVRVGSGTNKNAYGIKVNSGSTGTFVTNNDLTTSGVTSAFNDTGTGTITAAGNKLA